MGPEKEQSKCLMWWLIGVWTEHNPEKKLSLCILFVRDSLFIHNDMYVGYPAELPTLQNRFLDGQR